MEFKTVYQEGESLDIIKKSKFIGYIKPIKNVEEAQEFIDLIKKKHWDANHNVPVYVLGDKFQIQKYSDDGEPSGTAGIPILNMLKAENISNVVIVITRYFGGVKLGTGGLIRAYTKSAQSALEVGQVIEMKAYQEISVDLEYTLNGKFENFIMNHKEVLVNKTDYTDKVKWKLFLPIDICDEFIDQTIDLCHDQCEVSKLNEVMLAIGKDGWLKEA